MAAKLQTEPSRKKWSDYFCRSRSEQYEFAARKSSAYNVLYALDRIGFRWGRRRTRLRQRGKLRVEPSHRKRRIPHRRLRPSRDCGSVTSHSPALSRHGLGATDIREQMNSSPPLSAELELVRIRRASGRRAEGRGEPDARDAPASAGFAADAR